MIKRTLRLPSLVPLFLVDVTAGPSVPVSDENDMKYCLVLPIAQRHPLMYNSTYVHVLAFAL